MPRTLKKSIKNNDIIKVDKNVIWLCIVKQFFIAIIADSAIIPEYPSFAQTWKAPCIPIFSFQLEWILWPKYSALQIRGLNNWPPLTFFWLLATILMLWRAWTTCLLPKLYPLLLKDLVSVFRPYLSLI